MKSDRRLALIITLFVFCALLSPGAWALEPDEILLVCNPRVAASPELAMLYAKSRNVPLKNIVELSLPEGEQMPMDRFDPDVVMPLRNAVENRGLRSKIKCILTFYGVPLKLSPRTARPDEMHELVMLKESLDAAQWRLTAAVTSLEAVVIKHAQDFRPAPALDIPGILRRDETAMARLQSLLTGNVSEDARKEMQTGIMNNIAVLGGQAGLLRSVKAPMLASLTTRPATTQGVDDPDALWVKMERDVAAAQEQAAQAAKKRYDPASRLKLRELTAQYFGLVDSLRILGMQVDYLTPDGTNSFDSELSLLWVDDYIHKGPLENFLNYRSKQRGKTPLLMVARLDGPESGTAHQIMLACKAVEAKGLTGRFAIDSRGLPAQTAEGKPDAYGLYDQHLRDLADLVRRSTKIPLVLEDTPAVFQPNTKQDDIALYVGWYSVRNYVPALNFVPGSVGYHIGSYELMSLRDPQEKGWVRGMLKDGVAATLGPVDEPFLMAFPDPMEFFPLLLTGQYPLAEVYWLTQPTISWRMTLIGDPLYNPFKLNPALSIDDLPPALRTFAAPKQQLQYELPRMPGGY